MDVSTRLKSVVGKLQNKLKEKQGSFVHTTKLSHVNCGLTKVHFLQVLLRMNDQLW